MGYGSKFLDHIKKYCLSEGVDTIKISTCIENKRAQKFYQKNGGELRNYELKFYID